MHRVLAGLGLMLALADGQRTPICVPPVHRYVRLSWESQHDEFDQTRVYADHNMQQYRTASWSALNQGSSDVFVYNEVLYLPRKGAVYQITGPSRFDNSTWRCQSHLVPNEPVQNPCFTPNGTFVQTNRIGANLLVDNFQWTQRNSGTSPTNFHIQLTPAGVPVNLIHWNPMGHEVDTYLDFNLTLPDGAFAVPDICPPPSQQLAAAARSQLLAEAGIGYHAYAPRSRAARAARAALPAVAPVQQQSVCYPPVNALARRAWHAENNEYDRTVEYMDVPHKKARFTDRIFTQPSPTDPVQVEYFDILVDANLNKIYRTTQMGNDTNTRKCTVMDRVVEVRTPCFTTNGTNVRTSLVGGTLLTDIFFANHTDPAGIEHHLVILITPQGVPVQVAHTIPAHGFPTNPVPTDHWVELFEDFNATLPNNAFAVPPECSMVPAESGAAFLDGLQSRPSLLARLAATLRFL